MATVPVSRVAIVDDQVDSRETMRDELEYARLDAIPLTGPYRTLPELVRAVQQAANAAVCDHHLIANYAQCQGAEAVASLYGLRLPAVLVTAYSMAEMFEIRVFRRGIPVLLTPEAANPDSLMRGWEVCCGEFEGKFQPSRRPWQTLLYIEDVVDEIVYVTMPSWNSTEVVRLPKQIINQECHPYLIPGERLFAKVNKGAEHQSELFFEDFEYRGS